MLKQNVQTFVLTFQNCNYYLLSDHNINKFRKHLYHVHLHVHDYDHVLQSHIQLNEKKKKFAETLN